MATTSPTPVLSDDHIDLLVTAATAWHVLAESASAAAFAGVSSRHHVMALTPTQAGCLLRAENTEAIRWQSEHGRSRLVDRKPMAPYLHDAVDHLEPVEVIKAAQAAEVACADSPSWTGSPAARLLAGILTAATYRLDGYAAAPWWWDRPRRRRGRPLGVYSDIHPAVPGLDWVEVDQLREHWNDAPIIVVTVPAAEKIPVDLSPRPGIFVLVDDEPHNEVWAALAAVQMQTLVLFWPTCSEWLASQIASPAPAFSDDRSRQSTDRPCRPGAHLHWARSDSSDSPG